MINLLNLDPFALDLTFDTFTAQGETGTATSTSAEFVLTIQHNDTSQTVQTDATGFFTNSGTGSDTWTISLEESGSPVNFTLTGLLRSNIAAGNLQIINDSSAVLASSGANTFAANETDVSVAIDNLSSG